MGSKVKLVFAHNGTTGTQIGLKNISEEFHGKQFDLPRKLGKQENKKTQCALSCSQDQFREDFTSLNKA